MRAVGRGRLVNAAPRPLAVTLSVPSQGGFVWRVPWAVCVKLNKTGDSALFLLRDYPTAGGRCVYGREMVASRFMAPIVLVVEDEVLIRTDIADTLTRAGYVVLQAANADEAIRVMEHRSDVSLVFTDIGMPGSIDGLKLAHYVAKKWPPVRLLLTSGHHTLKPTDLPSGARFCSKPVSPAAMTAVIAELLGEAPPQEPLH